MPLERDGDGFGAVGGAEDVADLPKAALDGIGRKAVASGDVLGRVTSCRRVEKAQLLF